MSLVSHSRGTEHKGTLRMPPFNVVGGLPDQQFGLATSNLESRSEAAISGYQLVEEPTGEEPTGEQPTGRKTMTERSQFVPILGVVALDFVYSVCTTRSSYT